MQHDQLRAIGESLQGLERDGFRAVLDPPGQVSAGAGEPDPAVHGEWGGLPSEVLCSCWMNPGLFRAASLQTGHARFPGIRLSSDLCRVRDRVRVDPVMA